MSQHLPSPAPSPFPGGPGANPPRDAAAVRTELETQLKRLIQDLFELEVCAGSVEPGKEDVVPQYLWVVVLCLIADSQREGQCWAGGTDKAGSAGDGFCAKEHRRVSVRRSSIWESNHNRLGTAFSSLSLKLKREDTASSRPTL